MAEASELEKLMRIGAVDENAGMTSGLTAEREDVKCSSWSLEAPRFTSKLVDPELVEELKPPPNELKKWGKLSLKEDLSKNNDRDSASRVLLEEGITMSCLSSQEQ